MKNVENNEKFCSLVTKAYALWHKFKDKEALDYATEAIRLENDNIFALFIHGRILWSLEDYASALLELV